MKLNSPFFRIISLTLIFSLFTNHLAVTCPGLDVSANSNLQPSNLAARPLGNMDPDYVRSELRNLGTNKQTLIEAQFSPRSEAKRAELRSDEYDDDGDGWRDSQDEGNDDFNPMLASTKDLQIFDHGPNGREIYAHVIPKGSTRPTVIIHVHSKPQKESEYYFTITRLDKNERVRTPIEHITDDFAAVQKIEPYLTVLAENPEVQRELRDNGSYWQQLATLFALPAAWKNIIQGFADTHELEDEPQGEGRMEAIEEATREVMENMFRDESFEIEFLRWIVDDGFSIVAQRAGDLAEELVDKIKGELSRRNVLNQQHEEIVSAIEQIALEFVKKKGGFRPTDITYEGHVLKIDEKSVRITSSEGNSVIELLVQVLGQASLKFLLKSNGTAIIKRSWVKNDREINLNNNFSGIDKITALFESDAKVLIALKSSTRWRIILRKEFKRNIPENWRRAIDPHGRRSELRTISESMESEQESSPQVKAELRSLNTKTDSSIETRETPRREAARAELRADIISPIHATHGGAAGAQSPYSGWMAEIFDDYGKLDDKIFIRSFSADMRTALGLFGQNEQRARQKLERLIDDDPIHVAKFFGWELQNQYAAAIAEEYLVNIAQKHPKEVVNILVGALRNERSREKTKTLLIDLSRNFGREVANSLVGALTDEKVADIIKTILFEISNFQAKKVSNALIAALQNDLRRKISENILFELVDRGHEKFVREAAAYAIRNRYTSAPFAIAFLEKFRQNTAKEKAVDYLRRLALNKFVGLNATARRFHISTNVLHELLDQYGFSLAHQVPHSVVTSKKKRSDIWFVKLVRSELRRNVAIKNQRLDSRLLRRDLIAGNSERMANSSNSSRNLTSRISTLSSATSSLRLKSETTFRVEKASFTKTPLVTRGSVDVDKRTLSQGDGFVNIGNKYIEYLDNTTYFADQDLAEVRESALAVKSIFAKPEARSELRNIFNELKPSRAQNTAARVFDRSFTDIGFAPVLAADAVMRGQPVGLIVATRSELRVIQEINQAFGKIRVGDAAFDPILVAQTPEKTAQLLRSELRVSTVHYIYPEGFGISPQISRFFDEIIELKKSAMKALEFSVQGLLEATVKTREIVTRIAQMA